MQVFSFDKRALDYEKYAQIQRIAAKDLFSVIQRNFTCDFQKLLELGSGSGIFTTLLSENLNYNTLCCIDLCHNLIKLNKAQNRVRGDILYLPFKNNIFDTIVSSSTFQWIEDIKGLLKEIHRVSTLDCRLGFNAFLKGTFIEMDEVYKLTGFGRVLDMKTSEDYLKNCDECGFDVTFYYEKEYMLWYDSVLDFLKRHKFTGATIKSKKNIGKKRLFSFIDSYTKMFSKNGKIPATYKIGYVLLRKKGGDNSPPLD